jgi:hypothetical protein
MLYNLSFLSFVFVFIQTMEVEEKPFTETEKSDIFIMKDECKAIYIHLINIKNHNTDPKLNYKLYTFFYQVLFSPMSQNNESEFLWTELYKKIEKLHLVLSKPRIVNKNEKEIDLPSIITYFRNLTVYLEVYTLECRKIKKSELKILKNTINTIFEDFQISNFYKENQMVPSLINVSNYQKSIEHFFQQISKNDLEVKLLPNEIYFSPQETLQHSIKETTIGTIQNFFIKKLKLMIFLIIVVIIVLRYKYLEKKTNIIKNPHITKDINRNNNDTQKEAKEEPEELII